MVNMWDDEYNLEKRRNLRNADRSYYNCGGYELGTFNWIKLPYERLDKRWDWYRLYVEEKNEIVMELVEDMINRVPGLRFINDIKELNPSEYAIAFKLGRDDFHFAKRTSSGNWFHKRGATKRIERMPKGMVFAPDWVQMYDSSTFLMAKIK